MISFPETPELLTIALEAAHQEVRKSMFLLPPPPIQQDWAWGFAWVSLGELTVPEWSREILCADKWTRDTFKGAYVLYASKWTLTHAMSYKGDLVSLYAAKLQEYGVHAAPHWKID